MGVRPLIAAHEIRQAGMGTEEPQLDIREKVHDTVVAVVARVYPVGHPENDLGQTIVDLVFSYHLPPAMHVPMGANHAHQETDIQAPNTKNRQPYAPKARNRIEGRVSDVRPGTKVLVTFINGDLRSPIVLGTLRFNEQGKRGNPELAVVDVFGTDGKMLDLSVVNPLDSAVAEYPRDIDAFNGSRRVTDNRGNVHFHTTTDQEPVFPGHNGIPASPTPEGNFGVSTRGARQGSVGITTGKNPHTGEANARGNIRMETAQAAVGNLIARLRSGSGRLWASTRASDDGRVYIEDKKQSYVACRANGIAEMHGDSKAVLDADDVRLGNDAAPYEIVLWPQLNELMLALTAIFDTHVHSGVESGDSDTAVPTTAQRLLWIMRGAECKADHVKSVKTQGATPHYEDDPDGD